MFYLFSFHDDHYMKFVVLHLEKLTLNFHFLSNIIVLLLVYIIGSF